jgi:hypothetical protein
MLKHLVGVGPDAQGTVCAFLGMCVVCAFYFRAWRQLNTEGSLTSKTESPQIVTRPGLPSIRYFSFGVALSVLVVLSVGALDAGGELLDRVVGILMGLCGVIALGIGGVGFVAMRNLWKELIAQLKKAKILKLIFSAPVAIAYLAVGIGVFIVIGFLLDSIPEAKGLFLGHPLLRIGSMILGSIMAAGAGHLLWHIIAAMMGRLWEGESSAALMSRLILMVLFSAIMIPAAIFFIWWTGEQIAPLQVASLCVMAYANVKFYSRSEREAA